MDAKRRKGKEPDQDRVPLFDLLFSCPFFFIVICMDP